MLLFFFSLLIGQGEIPSEPRAPKAFVKYMKLIRPFPMDGRTMHLPDSAINRGYNRKMLEK